MLIKSAKSTKVSLISFLQSSNDAQFLKLASATFYQIFVLSPTDSPLKTMKNVFYFI